MIVLSQNHPIIEAFVDVKPSIEAKSTSVSKLRDNEVNATLFFSQTMDGEYEMIFLIGFVDKQQRRDLLYL